MIDLAPGDKQGLVVDNPVLIAGGMIGLGETIPRGLDLSRVGGAVVGPLTMTARAGQPAPRLGEGIGGLVLESGGQSRGVGAGIKKFAKLWPRLGCPVVAQLVVTSAQDAGLIASRLREVPGLAGLELMPLTDEVAEARRMVKLARQEGDLPLWVKLAPDTAVAWAAEMVQAGACGLVVGQAPRGKLPHASGQLVAGSLYGPLVFGLMLEVVTQVAKQELPASLIACGGIHTSEQMLAALDAGCQAVQVDSAIWVEPAVPLWLVDAWEASRQDV